MHLALGCVTVFFRVPLSCGKTLCASELQPQAKVCAGTGVFGGAVESGKALTHNECREVDRCEREKPVSYARKCVDTAKRVLLSISLRQSEHPLEWLRLMFAYAPVLQLNIAVAILARHPDIQNKDSASVPRGIEQEGSRTSSQHRTQRRGLLQITPLWR